MPDTSSANRELVGSWPSRVYKAFARRRVSTMSDGVIPVFKQELSPHKMVYQDEATHRVLKLAKSVARTSSTVLLNGESGVGKEVFAHAIHQFSPRASNPFIAVNCAALPSSILESELFGHEKGAFSGAVSQHIGHFERANSGTILLDEVSEVSLETQAKLLRVLQERSMLRVGGKQEIKLDIRIVATTNRNLMASVERGEFRLDLYYRLNVFPIHIPALRERPRDIEPLVMFYLSKFSQQFGVEIAGVTASAMERLERYSYPGNVRELVNIIERAVILCADQQVIEEDHILLDADMGFSSSSVDSSPNAFSQRSSSRHLAALSSRRVQSIPAQQAAANPDELETREVRVDDLSEAEEDPAISFLPGSEPLTDVRRKIIIGTLERFDGNRTRTAEALGVSLRTIRNKLRDYRERGIDVPSPDGDS